MKLTILLPILLPLLASAWYVPPPDTHHTVCDAILPAGSSGTSEEIDAALNHKDSHLGMVTANDCLDLCSCTDKTIHKCKDAPGVKEGNTTTDLCLKYGAPGFWECHCEKNN